MHGGLIGIFLDEVGEKFQRFFLLPGVPQVGDVIIQLGQGLSSLPQAQVEINELVAGFLVIRLKRAHLVENAQRLAPIQALHVNIRHAVQQVHLRVAVHVGLLGIAQGAGIGFACQAQVCLAVIHLGQLQELVHGLFHLAALHHQVNQVVAGLHIHRRQLADALQQRDGPVGLAAHAVAFCHHGILMHRIGEAVVLQEQVANADVQRQVGGGKF